MSFYYIGKKTIANKIREFLLINVDKELSKREKNYGSFKSIEFNTEYLSLKITMNETTFCSALPNETNESNELISSYDLINEGSRQRVSKSSNDNISEFVKDFDKKKQLISKNKKISEFITLNQHSLLDATIKITKQQLMFGAMKDMIYIAKSLKLMTPKVSFNNKNPFAPSCSCGNDTNTSSHETDDDCINQDEECQTFFTQKKLKNKVMFKVCNSTNDLKSLEFNINNVNGFGRNSMHNQQNLIYNSKTYRSINKKKTQRSSKKKSL